MTTRIRFARSTGRALLPFVLVGALTGCGPESAGPGTGDGGTPVVSESPEPSESEPSEEPTDEPTETEEPADGPRTLTEALLPADDVPGFNDEFPWQEGATETQEPQELAGTCHRFEMSSVGAEEVAFRTYQPTGEGDLVASELVAQFPDEETASRAFEVLQSWRADCKELLKGYDLRRVGDLEDVDTEVRVGHWYLLVYGPAAGDPGVDPETDPEAGYFDATGIAMVGDRIAVVRLPLIGQDYNYAAGEEPMVAAVRAAAARL